MEERGRRGRQGKSFSKVLNCNNTCWPAEGQTFLISVADPDPGSSDFYKSWIQDGGKNPPSLTSMFTGLTFLKSKREANFIPRIKKKEKRWPSLDHTYVQQLTDKKKRMECYVRRTGKSEVYCTPGCLRPSLKTIDSKAKASVNINNKKKTWLSMAVLYFW